MKPLSFSSFFKKIYKNFYFYCLSGNEEDRKLLTQQKKIIDQTGDNILIYLFNIMCNADIMDRDEHRKDFIKMSGEFADLTKNALDTWCYHQVLFLSYTYIYPDMREALKNKELSEEAFDKLSDKEKSDVEMIRNYFSREDYKIQQQLDRQMTMKDAYELRFSERDHRLQTRSYLMILKGFSSSTPFFYSALENRFYHSPIKGGGIYIKWNDHGIAIDPGINFMDNMHQNGLSISDIDTVIVTHDHIDHNGDLQVIDDMSYSFGHSIELYLDPKSYLKSEEYKCLKKYRHTLDSKIQSGYKIGYNHDIQLDFISTRHIITNENTTEYEDDMSFAIKLSLYDRSELKHRIGITSDTKFFPELCDFMEDCDYIIANMSEPGKDDYEKRVEKEKHLGYFGCLNLVRNCNKEKDETHLPRYIISEFWAGRGDVRRELVKRLREESGYSKIYPGDIGMLFFLDRPGFLCDYCGCESDIDDLHIVRDKKEYGHFSLVCDSCLLL